MHGRIPVGLVKGAAALVAASAVLIACDSWSSTAAVLPTGTSTTTTYWTTPQQSAPYVAMPGDAEPFRGTIAGKQLSGTVTYPDPATGGGQCEDPGLDVKGTLGNPSFDVKQDSCPLGSGASYSGEIGRLAISGSAGHGGDGITSNGSYYQTINLQGSYGGFAIRVSFQYISYSTATPSGQQETTKATVTVSPK
jgi:hypothetical protein